MSQGPVGMASTPVGTVFLYEMGAGDLAEYERQPYEDAKDRVRWLLTRVASKSSAGAGEERPAMLTRSEVAALGDDDVEQLADVFLASPSNQWHARKSQDVGALGPRAEDEGASSYLDRLVRWRSTQPSEIVVRRSEDAFAPATVAPKPVDAGMRQLLSWVSAGLAITVLLSTAALAFAAMAYFEAKDDHHANALWRAEMKRMQEARAPAAEKLVSELSAENARLRYRLELREAKNRAAAKDSSAAKPAPKSSSRSSSRGGRQ